jgi:hypothetical protein
MVLDAVSRQNPRTAFGFEEELSRLSSSPDYAIRGISRKILERLGHPHPPQSSLPRSLPADYRISLPPTGFGTFLPPREPSVSSSLPDPVGPLEVIGAVERELEIVAEQAGLPEQNVVYRAARLVTERATEGQLLQRYEDDLRDNLSSIGLRFPFNRPRFGLARRALFRVVAELTDAGELGADELYRLERILRFYDPVMLLTEPTPRPREVPPMPGNDRLARREDTWLEHTEEVLDLIRTNSEDGRIVLAEETKLKNLDWGAPTEKRRSVVRPSANQLGDEREGEAFFLRLVNRLYDEYPTLRSNRDEQPLIARHTAFARYLSPGENWLALNPAVGHRLGWSVGESGLFRWEDDAGRTAVESVWWQDSNPSHSPPEFRSEVGEGWLVLATERALSEISDVFGPLKRSVFVRREHTEEAGETPVAVAERDIEL